MKTATKTASKETIIAALYKWTAQRPGLEFGDYGDIALYRSEMRSITKDRHDAEALIRYCHISGSITAEMLLEALDGRNRLAWEPARDGTDGGRLEYCTGQYWPTEYRPAVSRVLSSILWRYFRENLGPDCKREDIQTAARIELGRPIAKRWFN